MIRNLFRIVAALLIAAQLPAQFYSLATDRHGSRVQFSTPLTLRGERRNDISKLVEVLANGMVQTVLSSPAQYTTTTPLETLNFPELIHPELSSDGLSTAWSGSQICDPRKKCGVEERVRGTMNSTSKWFSKTVASSGNARLSANGQWGLFYNPEAVARTYDVLCIDLQTGSTDQLFRTTGTPLWGIAPPGRRIISNDGTFVSATRSDSPSNLPTLFVHRRGSEVQTIALDRLLEALTISDDSRFAVGQTIGPSPSLVAVDLSTGVQTTLVSAAEGCRAPALSEDGSTLLFLSAANWLERNPLQTVQAWTMDLITGALEQWTEEPAGIVEATISGDGQILWASTLEGQILKGKKNQTALPVLWHTPIAEPIKGRPVIGNINPPPVLVPGSRYELTGTGLAEARLRWKGKDITILEASPTHLEFIIPWNAELGRGTAELENTISRFQPQQFTWELRPFAPRFLQTGEFASALHADGSALTVENPGRPDEIITLIMTGLGPINSDGNVLTTLSVSGSFPNPFVVQIERLEVLEAVMDPAQQGRYQLRVGLPKELPLPQLLITVQDEPRTDSASANIPVAVKPQ